MIYTATVTREGDMWLAEVPGLPGAHAYARTLSRLREELIDAVILSADLDDDADVAIEFVPADRTADPLIISAFELARHRASLREQECQVVRDTAEVAKQLIAKGFSVRDAAGALDVTPGRISQLVKN
ncbi:HicB-like antitoxin [Mycobacterium phage Purgamenstris]|uniref:HicB-like antitoxin n=5 Tax=Charlievirus redi TaxID=2003505 RepID=A0A1I9SC84_9CAUD|nr:HicB-like antitoxin [Mycobacterium phage Redi]AOZ64461.1 HicB-like antitoxin [Mycobacterium phage PhancyPhin]QAY16016.1 HicB-like antitoxin [Mycobacterium phage BabeRuth]QBI99231.1 HicB-like antitoxin [Mycobacterium phage Purgamenstris]QBI99907.1 HicB-like antitoxin [Mycobacterium phage ShrimpFriedEgg]AEN79924.1 hypothetical protein REDI_33 [Mycobacterium phage Redi]